MARMSIKTRVTIFYAGVLVFVALLISTMFLVALDLEIRHISRSTLDATVMEVYDHVISNSDWLALGSDLELNVHDVSLVLYGPEGTLILGTTPSGFPPSLPLISDEHQRVGTEGETWEVYDRYAEYPNGTGLWVRGIYSLRDSMASFRGVLWVMAIGLPLILLIATLLGYIITRRAFSPISRIQKTAEEIARNRDLSRRIALQGGAKDELYNLSRVFDSMFDQIEMAFNNEKQFSSDVSHELRTPVSVIISQAEYGLSEAMTPEEYKACLEAILMQAEKTSRLIGSLLQISRAANVKSVLIKEPLNLADLCDMVVQELSERAEERGIRIMTKLDRHIVFNGDQTQLMRMVINLVSNAITHGKDKGFVMLELHCDHERIFLSVSDDGIGIAPENLERIFKRFFQVEPEGSGRSSLHSGLGLPMVKMIAEAHGGGVKVQSTLDVGSTFTVDLPCAGSEERKPNDVSLRSYRRPT